MRIVRVAIPHPFVTSTLDYFLPEAVEPDPQPGLRLVVPYGKKTTTGYLVEAGENNTFQKKNLKVVDSVLDDQPLLTPEIIELGEWVAGYYFNSLGEVLKSALPPGINLDHEERIRKTPKGREFEESFSLEELHTESETELYQILSLVSEAGRPVKDLLKETSGRQVSRALQADYLETYDKASSANLELSRKGVELAPQPDDAEQLVKNAPKQRQALNVLASYNDPVQITELENEHGISRSVIKSLVEKGLAREVDIIIRRNPFREIDVEHQPPHDLTPLQNKIFEQIRDTLGRDEFSPFLLHGVTGSGKTEIYLNLILRALAIEKSVLVLIPEISLTPQFARRFYQVLGDQVAILHSGLSNGERLDEWFRVKRGEAKVVLGTRLSVFAPLQNLGLIIVDEEHDQSYKQDERVVFHARDVAVVRAAENKAVCVLGSATPSTESMANAQRGKYTLLNLDKRVFDRPLPQIRLTDLRTTTKKDEDQLLPDEVEDHLETRLAAAEQAMVMVSRKGSASFVLCRACGFSFECRTCSISMSWHEPIKKLKCHYCGNARNLPSMCPKCGSPAIEPVGMGTEKVEEYLKQRFPGATIDRMDRDIIRRPADYTRILGQFGRGEIDILVGTQMLAKGHDYPNVTTIVTLGVDSILRLPDFRHSERVFQLLTQVSGRAGRGENPGTVFLCTYKPEHFAIKAAAELDFASFYETEFEYRRSLGYPPFGYLTLITIERYDKRDALALATSIMEKLHSALGTAAMILGPSLAPYARLRNRWRYQLIVKSLDRVKTRDELHRLRKSLKNPLEIKIVVDPVSVM